MPVNRGPQRRASARPMHGFSLIEVLVTMVISAAGLLGLSGLILNSMRYNQSAGVRSISAEATQDLAERMRANLLGLRAGDYTALRTHADGLTGFTFPSCYDASTGALNNCSADAIAQADLAHWATSAATLLPSAGVRIEALATTNTYRVIVGYREPAAVTASTCPQAYAAPSDVRCFVIDVAP